MTTESERSPSPQEICRDVTDNPMQIPPSSRQVNSGDLSCVRRISFKLNDKLRAAVNRAKNNYRARYDRWAMSIVPHEKALLQKDARTHSSSLDLGNHFEFWYTDFVGTSQITINIQKYFSLSPIYPLSHLLPLISNDTIVTIVKQMYQVKIQRNFEIQLARF